MSEQPIPFRTPAPMQASAAVVAPSRKSWWVRFKADLQRRLQGWLLRKLAARMVQSGAMTASLPIRSQVTLGGKARVLNSYNSSRVAMSRALQAVRK